MRVWLAPRAYFALAAVVAVAAAGGALPLLWAPAVALGIALLAALAADAIAGPPAGVLTVRRLPPDALSLRRGAALRYAIENRSALRLRLGIIETPCALLHDESDEVLVTIDPHARAQAERRILPVARGSGELGRIYVWYENPLGLLRRRMRIEAAAPVRVYPDLSAVERYGTLHVRNKLIEAGLRRMRLRGTGTEPESVREWSSGDPFRAIEWKSTARRGKLMVAQYEVERSQNVMIVLDAGRLMTARAGEQRKFDYAVTAALSVAAVAALANDKVGVIAFAGQIVRAFAPRSTGRSAAQLSETLYDLEPRFEESDYDAAFEYLRTHVRKRSLVIFFTDMVDPVAQSAVLAQMGTLARRHLVLCAFMNDEAIDRALEDPLQTRDAVYAAGVALELRDERRAAAASLERLGVSVVDVPAAALTAALIDRYLRIKQRGML